MEAACQVISSACDAVLETYAGTLSSNLHKVANAVTSPGAPQWAREQLAELLNTYASKLHAQHDALSQVCIQSMHAFNTCMFPTWGYIHSRHVVLCRQ